MPRVPKLCEDPWIGELSRQRRQHWEVTRRLVFEPASSEVRALLRHLRRMRRTAGWRPHRQMEIAAARYDALALLYVLVDSGVLTDMKRWALQRAVDWIWEVPSQNFYGDISTHEVALKIRDLEAERGFIRAVMEAKEVADAEETWAETAQDWAAYDAQSRWPKLLWMTSAISKSSRV
jgi:hypothetical protein